MTLASGQNMPLTDLGISCLVLIISLVSSFYVKEMSRSPRDLVIMA